MNTNFFDTLTDTPDQSLLPNVWLTWATKRDGTIYLCCANGKIQNNRESWMDTRKYGYYMTYTKAKESQFCVNAGTTLKFAYSKYHESAGLLELAVVTMNSYRTGGARIWQYAEGGERYFINKQKQIYDANGCLREDNDMKYTFCAYEYHSSFRFKDFLAHVTRCSVGAHFTKEFQKFLGNSMYISRNGRASEAKYAWNVQDWYETPSTKRTTGKTQKLLDELSHLPSRDLKDVGRENPILYNEREGYYSNEIKDIVVFEHLNDEWSVLRYCYRDDKNNIIESYRIFISESGDCKLARLTNNNEWIPAQNLNHEWNRSYGRIINYDEAEKCKRLSYILPIVKTFSERQQITALTMIFKHPQLEKLFKMNYPNFAKALMADGTVAANIKKYIGTTNKKAKNLFSEWGINKYQLEFLESTFMRDGELIGMHSTNRIYYQNCITEIKQFFGTDISSLDNATFNRLAQLMAQFHSNYMYRKMNEYLNAMHVPDLPHWLNHTARLLSKPGTPINGVQVLCDTIKTYNNLDDTHRPENFNWNFDSYSDITRAHDVIITLQLTQERERRALYNIEYAERLKKEEEMRKKIDEKRKHYEYEDDNYIIRLPVDSDEIINEGHIQHICIGGYTNQHSTGNTNLFFLREKNAPNTPFYAIEMKNNVIKQIHGFGNRWLGNNPEAIPTVVRWLRKHNITCDQKILTCTATGYSRTGTYIPMPVVED